MNKIYKIIGTMSKEDFLNDIIHYLKNMTLESDWCVDVVRTKDQKQNCLMGHLFNFGGNLIVDIFHNNISTEYCYYQINDGKNPNYPQATPKQRIIAYLENVRDGKEETVLEYYQKKENEEFILREFKRLDDELVAIIQKRPLFNRIDTYLDFSEKYDKTKSIENQSDEIKELIKTIRNYENA
jgi:hypothetical protein